MIRAPGRTLREVKRRVLRTFAGVEYVSTIRHEDGTRTITFVTFDDNADEVLESIEDLLEQGDEHGIRVVVVPHD